MTDTSLLCSDKNFNLADDKMRDWNAKVRAPLGIHHRSDMSTRITRLLTKHSRIIFILFVFSFICLILILIPSTSSPSNTISTPVLNYNYTYPLSLPLRNSFGYTYRIAIVSDLDQNSKVKDAPNLWVSYLLKGDLQVSYDLKTVAVVWDREPLRLESKYSLGGRGMELSELVVFNGELLTVDDRTGIVYKVVGNRVYPWVILADGDGTVSKGFKAEWMTVKDRVLYVGGLGKEWTTPEGEPLNRDPQWVKAISVTGQVVHMDWSTRYDSLRSAAGIAAPGYIIHEAVCWSAPRDRWIFLPRRVSRFRYNEMDDERRAGNIMITADESFTRLNVAEVTPLNLFRGFSSFKFVPNSQEQLVVALKSEENSGDVSTYITVFNVDGNVLVTETKIAGNIKYEGVEFI